MQPLHTARILEILRQGELSQVGLVPWGSNYTFLVQVCEGADEVEAIYKPRKGERPLWDFPRGTLCLRERAAFLISEALDWGLVPPTVLRDGSHGFGSLQYFVDHDPDQHYFNLEGDFETQLQRIALFDTLINNADRKGGHVLLDKAGRLWSIDHGICFHVEHKLRSVIWDFAGEPISADLRGGLVRLQSFLQEEETSVRQELNALLSRQETDALQKRLLRLLNTGAFPRPGPGRHYPWPPV